MARLIERILIWVAALVTIAAIVAVVINFFPGMLSGLRLPGLIPTGPNGTTSTIDLAEQAMTHGDPRKALTLGRQAVDENPGDTTVANRAGNVALRAGDPRSAEKYYLIGEDDDRRYPWNFVALGELYERQGKKEPADEQLRAAIAAAPNQQFVHYDLGVVELEEGLYAAALADFEAELKRSPTYRPAMVGRAEALEKVGRMGEAVASYRRAGINTGQQNARRPKLVVTPIVQPSPTPIPSPSVQIAVASAPPSVQAAPGSKRNAAPPAGPPLNVSVTTAGPVRPPWATPTATATRPLSATALPSPQQSSAVATAPTAPGKALSDVSADARSYVLDVAQDLGFTRSLPPANPSQTTAALRFSLMDALAHKPVDVESLLRTGTAALLSGRLTLASTAFTTAADAAPHDWHGPYFAGLTQQANGDIQQARSLFGTALSREPRAEIYTSLALIDLQNGDAVAAGVNAHRAVDANASYEPGRFVAGMVDLIQSDLRGAERNLSAANTLGGAPARTAYFLTRVHDIIGASTDQRS